LRVRRSGQSYAHPLVVLVIHQGGNTTTRFAVTAGLSVGSAVRRNRAKRLLRAALQDLVENIKTGYDCVLIARKPLASSTCSATQEALRSLFAQAGISLENRDG
jgi:ribonuclease P protein component